MKIPSIIFGLGLLLFTPVFVCGQDQIDLSIKQTDGPLLSRYVTQSTEKWEKEIRALEQKDAVEKHPDDAILFVGSSSIRLWDEINEALLPWHVIKRGFGGSRYSDVAVYAKRLIQPHRYQGLVLFVGNDIAGKPNDHTPEEVSQLLRYVVDVSKATQPKAAIFVVAVTPTPSRFDVWPKIAELNDTLEQVCQSIDNVHFISTAESYLDDNHQPKSGLFREDQLHQNDVGYNIWSGLIKAKLDEVLNAN